MTIKVVGALPDPFYNGSKRKTKTAVAKKNEGAKPNRYTYRIGVVQQIIREVIQHPNQWSLVREGSKNRSSLAPTLQKYKQIRFSTRKRADGLFDIYAMYTPDKNGNPDKVLEKALAEWDKREQMALGRVDETQENEKAGV